MNKLILALFAMAVFFVPFSAQAARDAEILATTCIEMAEGALEDVLIWSAENAGLREEIEFIELATYLNEYCTANPNATFQEAMLAAQ